MIYMDNQILHPEEALYMMESQKLIVLLDNIPISVQQAMQITNLDLDIYHLYSSLKRAAYLVFRSTNAAIEPLNDLLESEKPIFVVYKSKKGFKSTTRGNPDYQVLLCRKNMPSLDTLMVVNNSVPTILAIIDHGNLNYLRVS